MNNESLDFLTQRCVDFVNETVFKYNHIKQNLPADKSINLVCFVGNEKYDVYSIRPCKGGGISISTKTDDGIIAAVFAQLEQIYFSAEVCDKKTDEHPRNIGLKALWETSGLLTGKNE